MKRGRFEGALLALTLIACAEPGACPRAQLDPLPEPPTFAVASTDYGASASALLDLNGELLEEAWLDSGTTRPGVVAALSGDISFPSAPFEECTLVVLDRFGTNVITFLDVCGQEPLLGQVVVGHNPQDVLWIDGATAWVTRHNPNLDGNAAALDRGNDVVVVDRARGRVVDRIDMSALDEGEAFARPMRMVRLRASDGAERVVVGTARLSGDFQVAASGALAVVDPVSHEVAPYLIDGLSNCGELDGVPDDPTRLVATCAGATFGEEADRRAAAGVVLLELGAGGALVEVAIWRAAEHPEVGAVSASSVPLGGGRVVSVANGDVATSSPDRAVLLDLEAGTAQTLFEASGPFVLGDGAYDRASELLLIPDAGSGEVRRLRSLVPLEPISTAGCRGLPPREITRIR